KVHTNKDKQSKNNIDTLKAKYQQITQQQSTNSAQASKLRQEYNKQANSINYLESELEQTRNKYREMIAASKSAVGRMGATFTELGPKIKGIGDSMKSVGRSMSMYVTAPIAAGFGAAVKKSIDFDDTML